MINNSQLIIMDSLLGHLCFNELENISDDLNDFMSQFEEQDEKVNIVDFNEDGGVPYIETHEKVVLLRHYCNQFHFCNLSCFKNYYI